MGQGTPASLASDGIGVYVERMTYLEQIGYTQQSLLEEFKASQADAKIESATFGSVFTPAVWRVTATVGSECCLRTTDYRRE